MNQITVTLTLEPTPKKLALLAALCDASEEAKIPAHESPVPNETVPVTEPQTDTPALDKTYSATDVKAVCLKLSKEGRQADLKAAFAKFGAKKLSEVKPEDYPALMKELGHE